MLAALAKADRIAPAPSIDNDAAANGKLSKGARKRRNRRTRKEAERKAKRNAERPLSGCKIRFDHQNNRIDWDHYKNRGERMAVLAPGELDDDISDLFPPIPADFDNTIEELDALLEDAYGKVPPAPKPAKPFKAWNDDGTVYLGEAVLKRAAEIKAERKAEAKAAAAEARKIRNAEKRAAGLPLRWFIGAAAAGAVLAPVAFFFGLQPYQQKRVFTFLDPESDPLGDGYHITQSKIAIGSGGFSGKGFNEGSQSHLNYLPEPHTDFIFATMAEEWGFLGGIVVLGAFAMILRWGLSVARASSDRFGKLIALGMTATIFFYVAINLMMVMGLAPVVGIPLPFMSHGGSSMLTNMICIGSLMLVHRWNRKAPRTGLLR